MKKSVLQFARHSFFITVFQFFHINLESVLILLLSAKKQDKVCN